MLELIISYFLTKFNIITKKPNNPDCHLNHSVSMGKPNHRDIRTKHPISRFSQKRQTYCIIIPALGSLISSISSKPRSSCFINSKFSTISIWKESKCSVLQFSLTPFS